MGLDVLTVGVAFFSFGIFLLVHLASFRRLSPEKLLRSLLTCVMAVMGLPVVVMGVLYAFKTVEAPLAAWVAAAVLASVIQGLLSFVYVLCIFGPYETSVRMRLVREIASAPAGGISKDGILERYNHRTIVDLRLRRLVGSGDIIEKDGLYSQGRRGNFFFVFDAIAGGIKKWIDR